MYQADQIQSMISELDRVLRQTERWRLWNIFSKLSDQRQMLERVRTFLLMQQRSTSVTTSATLPAPQAPSLMRPLPPPHLHPESLKIEVTALTAQRDALREEIKFLSTLAQPTNQTTASKHQTPHLDAHQTDQLSALHDRTDFLLASMDSSLQLAFTSMQKNVDVYQTSLHQGLDRMHNLGYQGEVLFSALVNHLAQQMGRQLSANPATTFTEGAASQDITPSSNLPAIPLRGETAVSFAPDSALCDRDMTLDTLFGDTFGDTFGDILSADVSTPVTTTAYVGSNANDDMTLEEMNALFSDLPSPRS